MGSGMMVYQAFWADRIQGARGLHFIMFILVKAFALIGTKLCKRSSLRTGKRSFGRRNLRRRVFIEDIIATKVTNGFVDADCV